MIPYSTIKFTKKARLASIRECVYEVFHRPDKSSLLRSLLDLWGFDSYANYLYTICELGFLEGVIPVVDFGFLTPDEIKSLSELAALIKVPLFSDYDFLMDKYDVRSYELSSKIRSKSCSWVNKLGYSNSTGFFAYKDQSHSYRKELLREIASQINTHQCVHEVVLTVKPRFVDKSLPLLTDKEIMKLYDLARSIIPEDVPINIPGVSFAVHQYLIEQGERDLGSFDFDFVQSKSYTKYKDELNTYFEDKSFRLQKRFALRKKFIFEQLYSKKLGQVFDAYKYKIKKSLQEKQKEAKQ